MSKPLRISCLPPCFIPYDGWWARLLHSDILLLMMGMPFVTNEYFHRVPLDGKWLSLHVKKGATMRETRIVGGQKKIVSTLEQRVFSKAKKKSSYDPNEVLQSIANAEGSLEAFNTRLILKMVKQLGLVCDVIPFPYQPKGASKTARLMAYLSAFTSQELEYITGAGGLSYLDLDEVPSNVTIKVQQLMYSPTDTLLKGLASMDDYLGWVGKNQSFYSLVKS